MEFWEKLVAIQSDIKAPKDKENKFGGFRYRSCEGILEAAKPLLAREGLVLSISDEIVEVTGRVYVKATATITDGTNSQKVTAYAREADTKKGMDPSQVTGASSSYARKYALNGLFCIDDAKDADTDEYQKMAGRSAKKDKEDTISFGTASAEDSALPFDVGGEETPGEPIELLGLKSLMKKDNITEEQVLNAFKGKYSAIENIEPNVITEMLLDKWESFVKFVNKGGKTT
jgi:hypothetical protein